MGAKRSASRIVLAGDAAGRGNVYTSNGDAILADGESTLRMAENWDMDVISPWRRVLPRTIFAGFNGKATSRLYITTRRILLLRQVDSWREAKGDMTPLGMPNAIAKKAELDHLRAGGAWEFCEIHPAELRIVEERKRTKPNSWLSMKLIGTDSNQYAIMIWKTDGVDDQTLSQIRAQFAR